jgi:AraC-like DNA-binding protein
MSQQTTAFEQLAPGRLAATDCTAMFGSVLMSRATSNLPALIRLGGLPGWVSYVLPEPGHSVYCRGVRCEPEQCLVVGSSADVELICREPGEVTVCRIRAKQSMWSPFQYGTYLAGNAPEISRVRAILSSLQGPQKVSHADLRDRLAEFSTTVGTAARSSGTHRTLSIERGRRHIHANFSGALRIASVCEAAGIRSRTLEYGFRELFGISPVSYIKAVRLNHARRSLLSAAAAGRTITAMALDSGFWHLSQFAADYQKFFGESPSTTRRRSSWEQPMQLRQTEWFLKQDALRQRLNFSAPPLHG